MSTANPFLDSAGVSALYDREERLAQRTSALHVAKVAGRYVPHVVADLAMACALPPNALVLDLGCGRGSTTIALARALPADAHIVAVDLSPAMLTAARTRNRDHQ